MDLGAVIVALGTPMVFGFGTWLGKVWSDRIARNEQGQLEIRLSQTKGQLESERERHRLVFSKHFELEFELYRRMWSCAVAVVGTTQRLRPDGFFWASADEKERNQRERELAEQFDKAQVAFQDTFLAHRPFISNTLYQACEELWRAALDEFHPFVNLLAHKTTYSPQWREERTEHFERMNKQMETILAEIRLKLIEKGPPLGLSDDALKLK